MNINPRLQQNPPPTREPLFNVPAVVLWLLVLLLAVHAVRVYVLGVAENIQIVALFAFIPLRFVETLPGGVWAQAWSFVTYGLLHGGWDHVILNVFWMAIFGTAVARRFGASRFMLLTLACTAAGAVAHLVTHSLEFSPMVGASAAISGHMAAAARFVFEVGGPLSVFRSGTTTDWRRPATPFLQSLSNRSTLAFLAIWFAMNFLFGLGMLATSTGGPTIAWEAHIGGFLAGLVLFPLLDPVGPRRRR